MDFSDMDLPVSYSAGPRLFREPTAIVRGENWSQQSSEAFNLFVRQLMAGQIGGQA
jgi:hypothetical protein